MITDVIGLVQGKIGLHRSGLSDVKLAGVVEQMEQGVRNRILSMISNTTMISNESMIINQ